LFYLHQLSNVSDLFENAIFDPKEDSFSLQEHANAIAPIVEQVLLRFCFKHAHSLLGLSMLTPGKQLKKLHVRHFKIINFMSQGKIDLYFSYYHCGALCMVCSTLAFGFLSHGF